MSRYKLNGLRLSWKWMLLAVGVDSNDAGELLRTSRPNNTFILSVHCLIAVSITSNNMETFIAHRTHKSTPGITNGSPLIVLTQVKFIFFLLVLRKRNLLDWLFQLMNKLHLIVLYTICLLPEKMFHWNSE